MRLTVSTVIPARRLATVSGPPVPVPDPDRPVHLQFRRFAGCPVCSLHLRSFATRNDEVMAVGVHEVVVFHSPAEELRPHVADLPFAAVADPGKRLYTEFGVESASRALLDPRSWPAIVWGVLTSLWGIVRHRRPAPESLGAGRRFASPTPMSVRRGICGRMSSPRDGRNGASWPVGRDASESGSRRWLPLHCSRPRTSRPSRRRLPPTRPRGRSSSYRRTPTTTR